MKKIFYLEIEHCCDCPYGIISVCDLLNEEIDSSSIHPRCPLPEKISEIKLKENSLENHS